MKRLLLITDVFPPQFAPRMGYLCKYLARHTDWKVVCLHEEGSGPSAYAATFGHLAGFVDREFTYEREDGIFKFTFGEVAKKFLMGERKFLEFLAFIAGKLLFHLRYRGLDYSAHCVIDHILREYHFDLILCSTGNFRAHELGEYARRISGLPVIQDVRDLIEELDCQKLERDRRLNWLVKYRGKCFGKANALTVCVDSFVKYLSNYNDNISLIYNGYDPDVFHPVAPLKAKSFDIVYVGSVSAGVSVDVMVDGVLQFARTVRDLSKIRVIFYSTETAFESEVRPFIPDELSAVIQRKSSVPQSDLVSIMAAASVLMRLNATTNQHSLSAISTKIFEYLAVNRPILDISPNGFFESEAVIREMHAGKVAQTADEVAQFLIEKFHEWEANGFTKGTTDMEQAGRFSREVGGRQFVDVMEMVLSKAK